MMNIVIVDGHPLNTGDLNWEPIAAFGNLKVYDWCNPDETIERCREADIVLTNKVPFDKVTIAQLPKLKMIGVLATGYNIIDTVAAKERGILVCNVPGYSTASVAQHVFALLFELTNQVGLHASSVAAGDWQRTNKWCYTKAPLVELDGKTMGIVGLGHIGLRVAAIAQALGMKIIYFSRSEKNSQLGKRVELKELFAQSDVVSLHCPLTADNEGFVNAQLIQQMKPSAYLINTARGPLIDETALADALNKGVIAGAGLDVLSTEPPKAENPLIAARNCVITPHTAWISREARGRVIDIAAENIKAWLDKNPINVVSG